MTHRQTRALPGCPNLPLDNGRHLLEFLDTEFWAKDLHYFADRLWWMTNQDSPNISPLHRQIVKRRSIIVTEDPKLHLVWIHDRIFIKPLPQYIFSHAFWRDILRHKHDSDDERQKNILRAGLGYLGTYCYLIQYESGLRPAKGPSLCLIPDGTTWEQFCALTSDLSKIADDDVSERYHFGEIRFTCFNFYYAPITLRRWTYHRVENQSATYFARFYGPILFMVRMFSVILSGFQVSLEANHSHALSSTALGFIIFSILGVVVIPLGVGLIFVLQHGCRVDMCHTGPHPGTRKEAHGVGGREGVDKVPFSWHPR